MSEELPFALMLWIKREQEKEEKHKEAMVKRTEKEDDIFTRMLTTLEKLNLKPKEMIMVKNFIRHKVDGKNFTTAQRSVITSIFYNHVA